MFAANFITQNPDKTWQEFMDATGGSIAMTSCETMKQAKENAKVDNAINNLKTKTTGHKEYAYSISRQYNNSTHEFDFDTEYMEGGEYEVSVRVGDHWKGNVHNHPKDGQSIPSIGDILTLEYTKKYIAPKAAVAYNIVVCANPASPNDTSTAIVYAIVTSDYTALETKVNELLNRNDLINKTLKDKQDKLLTEYGKLYKNVQTNSAGMEKKFLELFNGFGMDLMKLDPTTGKWNKITLQNNTLTQTPCE
jgi:hypothetical protein